MFGMFFINSIETFQKNIYGTYLFYSLVLYTIYSHKKHGIKRFCDVLVTAMEVPQERFKVPELLGLMNVFFI